VTKAKETKQYEVVAEHTPSKGDVLRDVEETKNHSTTNQNPMGQHPKGEMNASFHFPIQ